jgi:cold shock protein
MFLRAIFRQRLMMGRREGGQSQFFYSFDLSRERVDGLAVGRGSRRGTSFRVGNRQFSGKIDLATCLATGCTPFTYYRVRAEGLCFCAFLAHRALNFLSRISILSDQGVASCGPDQLFLKGHVMHTGIVKWFNAHQGFGFIQPESGGRDVFVHISAVERAGLRDLAEGQKITYELVSDRNGKTSADQLQVAA